MFRVLCERHPDDTPELTRTHRLHDPHDRAAVDLLRAGEVAAAIDELERAGHLHVVEGELATRLAVLTAWWRAHLAGHDHPMVDRQNAVRGTLNRLAHQLRRAAGELGHDALTAAGGRRSLSATGSSPAPPTHPPPRGRTRRLGPVL